MNSRKRVLLPWYAKDFLANAFKPGSLLIEVLGLLLGLAGFLTATIPTKWTFFYFLILVAVVIFWNAYKVASRLYIQVERAESMELLIKSRAQVRAIEKTRIVRIAEKGEKDILETYFLVEAVSVPVSTFYCRFMTDHQEYILNDEDWQIVEGKAVRANMYKIGRKYAEFIVENELFKSIFRDEPRDIHIIHKADLINPEEDWAGVDIMEETQLATLEIWFPIGWHPIKETIERFVIKDEEETPRPGLPHEIGRDSATGQWFIKDRIVNCEMYVSNCVRWRAAKDETGDLIPSTLSELEPRIGACQ